MVQRPTETTLNAPRLQTSCRPRLRVLGTAVTLIEPIRERAVRDLGIDLDFIVLDGVTAQRRAAIQPSSYDVYDQWFHNVAVVWSSGALQPIRTSRIRLWENLVRENFAIGIRGLLGSPADTPQESLYVQADLRLSGSPTERISAVPTVFNVDAFGYLPEAMPRELMAGGESWGWLLDDRLRGRVAVMADPTIGSADAAMAAHALGLVRFTDIGRPTIEEIDQLTRILIRKRRSGHFGALWHSIEDASSLMAKGVVAIESMWSPTLSELRARGVPVSYARPREGYRAWHGCIGLSSQLRGRELDAAYDYINWWLAGWAGAVMARQGYYFAIPSSVQAELSAAEWGYWYQGEPAKTDLADPYGRVSVRAGEVRDGGAQWQRLSHIALWSTTVPEHNYLVRRWSQFLAAGPPMARSARGKAAAAAWG
jgi:putative spermidine/putrescine transport system substrate-binding protein